MLWVIIIIEFGTQVIEHSPRYKRWRSGLSVVADAVVAGILVAKSIALALVTWQLVVDRGFSLGSPASSIWAIVLGLVLVTSMGTSWWLTLLRWRYLIVPGRSRQVRVPGGRIYEPWFALARSLPGEVCAAALLVAIADTSQSALWVAATIVGVTGGLITVGSKSLDSPTYTGPRNHGFPWWQTLGPTAAGLGAIIGTAVVTTLAYLPMLLTGWLWWWTLASVVGTPLWLALQIYADRTGGFREEDEDCRPTTGHVAS